MENKTNQENEIENNPPEEEASLIPEKKETEDKDDDIFLEDEFDEEEENEFFEGDFFWLFQKFMWGLLQVLVIGFVLFILIWWIGGKFWGNNEDEKTQPNQETVVQSEESSGFWPWSKSDKETTEPSSEEAPAPSIPKSSTVEVEVSPFAKESLVDDSLYWLNAASTLGGSVFNDINTTPNNSERAQKIEYLLNDSEKLLEEAQRLKALWTLFLEEQAETKNLLEQKIKNSDKDLKAKFSAFDASLSDEIEKLKIYKKAYVQVSQDVEVSQMMLKNITNFETSFRKKVFPLFPNVGEVKPAN